jgi:hypothetical protein
LRQVAGQIPENSNRLVATIVQKVVGQEVRTFEQIKGYGFNNAVTIADTSAGRFVVRTNVDSHLFRFHREAWCYQRLGERGVLVPEVIGCGIEAGHSFSLAHYIEDSVPIHPALDQSRVWKILGRYAAIMNSITESVVDGDGQTRDWFPVKWREQVAGDLDLIFKDNFWVGRKEITENQEGKLRDDLQQIADLECPRGVCQFDLTTGNARICESNYDRIYLFDLEWANVAPVPYYQLACIAAEHGPESEVTAAFFEGYGVSYRSLIEEGAELSRFTLLRAMRAAAWARDRAPNLLEENLRKTRPLIERFIGSN